MQMRALVRSLGLVVLARPARTCATEASLSLLRNNVGLTHLDVPVDDDGVVASLVVPSDQDELLNMYITHEAELGGLTPYYGVIWPSALALSRNVGPSEIEGAAVLELGCGVGLAGIAAALTGAPRSVLLTDLDPIAVELSRLGAERSGVAQICSCAVRDWHQLDTWPAAAFDVAIAADVLYEPEACDAIAALLARTLRPGGTFLLADGKGRRNRPLLWEGLLASGAFERDGEERWVRARMDDAALGEPRGKLDRRVREDAKERAEQAVVIARFVRTETPAVPRAVGVC